MTKKDFSILERNFKNFASNISLHLWQGGGKGGRIVKGKVGETLSGSIQVTLMLCQDILLS